MERAAGARLTLIGPSALSVCALAVTAPLLRDVLVRMDPAGRVPIALGGYALMLGLMAVTVLRFGLSAIELGLCGPIFRSFLLGSAAALPLLAAPGGHMLLVRTPTATITIWILLAVAVEEIVFRGLVFAVLRRLAGLPCAVAGSAIAFALAHGYAYQGRQLLVLAIAGAYLGLLRALAGNLWAPGITHSSLDLLTISG